MKASFLLSIFSMVLISCSTQPVDSTIKTQSSSVALVSPESTHQPSLSKPTASDKTSSQVSKTLTISATGIGSARLEMTLGQLKQALGENAKFQVVSPFIVDFDAIAVSQSGKVQYYIIYPAGTTLAETDPIELLLTENPNFRTAEGVGPGIPLKQAEAVYGDTNLYYNTQNESREQVKFANQPAQNLFFQPTAPEQEFAGIYQSPLAEYNETKKFHETASIRSVLVRR